MLKGKRRLFYDPPARRYYRRRDNGSDRLAEIQSQLAFHPPAITIGRIEVRTLVQVADLSVDQPRPSDRRPFVVSGSFE